MPTLSPPPPVNQDVDSRQYKDWFYSIYALLATPGSTLGTMAYQNYDNVGITGGQISNVGLTSVRTNGLSGYLKGNGSASPITASTTIPWSDITGAPSITSPSYGAFQNSADQTFSTSNTPTIVALNTTDYSRNVTLSSNRLTASVAGMYNLEYSFQLGNTDTSIHEFNVWLRKNGTDVAGTNSTASCVSSHGGTDGYAILAANFYIQLAAGDYVELWSAVSNTAIRLDYIPAQTTPYARPYSPSSVVTLTQIA